MKKPFESILARARKLAAMADPANGASPQEQETARVALEELRERYDLKPEDIDEASRERRGFVAKSRYRDQKPRLDKNLAMMARVCFAYVVGDITRKVRIVKTEEEVPTRGFSIKTRAVYFVEADCTLREYDEWRDCFDHYAPDFIEMNDERREALKQAKYEYENAWAHFCGENDIVPPLPESPPPSMAQMLRELGAKRAPKVAPWGRAKLTESNLLT